MWKCKPNKLFLPLSCLWSWCFITIEALRPHPIFCLVMRFWLPWSLTSFLAIGVAGRERSGLCSCGGYLELQLLISLLPHIPVLCLLSHTPSHSPLRPQHEVFLLSLVSEWLSESQLTLPLVPTRKALPCFPTPGRNSGNRTVHKLLGLCP